MVKVEGTKWTKLGGPVLTFNPFTTNIILKGLDFSKKHYSFSLMSSPLSVLLGKKTLKCITLSETLFFFTIMNSSTMRISVLETSQESVWSLFDFSHSNFFSGTNSVSIFFKNSIGLAGPPETCLFFLFLSYSTKASGSFSESEG